MVLESACVPIPSEAVMLFGGPLAGGIAVAASGVRLNAVGVALAGAGGHWRSVSHAFTPVSVVVVMAAVAALGWWALSQRRTRRAAPIPDHSR